MSTALSVCIPAGKLSTVRVDRTVDAYPTSHLNNQTISTPISYIPKLTLQRQCTDIPTSFVIEHSTQDHFYVSTKQDNNKNTSDDEDTSDIAVIYSVVRRSSTRRTSSPRLPALPLIPNANSSQPYLAKSYTLEPPLTPVVSHVSRQAQIKTLTSKSLNIPSCTIPTALSSLEANAPNRIQSSVSFKSSGRPSVPLVTLKPRPYSFRSPGRIALERQIISITERVSHLQETLFSRLSNSSNTQQNNSLSNFSSTLTNTDTDESDTSNINSIKTRPKSDIYDNHHHIDAAGSYAQLTLLGQSRANSVAQPQKPIPIDYQNDRVQFRTQHSNLERPHSTIVSSSLQTTSETKKVRDNYEKIFKQLEATKKELERQKLKGMNHNPTRILQLENQVKQHEQQLNKIKPFLEMIDSSIDPSATFHEDNVNSRPNTMVEQSVTNRSGTQSHGTSGHKKQNSLPESAVLQVMTGTTPSTSVSSPLQHIKRKLQSGKTEAYDLVKNWDSSNTVPTDETFKFRESSEIDDDNSHTLPSNVQSISSFDDLQQSINSSNWIPLTIFLNFLLNDANSDPNSLLFYILTEELRSKKAEYRSQYIRWIFEIHSTFTMNASPLSIGLSQSQADAISRWLESHQQEPTEDARNIFNEAKEHAKSIIIDRSLEDFNHKRNLSINNDLNLKPHHFIEETLRSAFEQNYKSSSTDDWNSIKNARSSALTCALATYLKRCDIKKCGSIPLEKIPKFLEKDPKGLLAKLQRTAPNKKIKDHQLNEHQFLTETLCQVCSKSLWGINCQGYLCGYCQQVYHRECASNSEKCSKDRGKLRKYTNSRNPSSPSRSSSVLEGREGSGSTDITEAISSANEGIDPTDGNLSIAEQNRIATISRASSDRRAAPDRPVPPKYRSSSNPQMGGNTIDELLNQRMDGDINNQQDSTNINANPLESMIPQSTEYDSDLEADVNTLPNLNEFIANDVLQVLYQTREWKFQTTINELLHTQRTHLKSLKIMIKCFREPMETFPGMSPVELECIFRNLDQLINLHTEFKYALFQHREEAKDHVVRNIGDLILKFLDGEKGEEFAAACAYFIEDQSQALKLIKKKEQSPDFAQLMRACEAKPLCRRLTLKDYLPSVMTRFTKYKLLFEAMKKFTTDDLVESEKLSRCIECADNILKRMNEARLRKEQEALIKQIKSNLEIQIPNDDKLKDLQECLESVDNRLLYSGTLKLLPDSPAQRTEFECCLFTDIFVFFQKIPTQTLEQRGIEESYKYVLKEHQRDATSGRHQRTRPLSNPNKYPTGQNFILTPIIRLEHLLIKKKACGGARSFYVIDTDKKQLIEVEANSKDDLQKWLEWIDKARKPFEKIKTFSHSSHDKNSQSTSTINTQSTIAEEESNNQLVESNGQETPESILNEITNADFEIKRLLHEKQLLLSRLLNGPQDSSAFSAHSIKSNSALQAITYAASYHNQLTQIISQIPNEIDKNIDIQSISSTLVKIGEQLTAALKFLNNNSIHTDKEYVAFRRNSSSFNVTPSVSAIPSQTYSDLSISSLHSSESLGSVVNPYQAQLSSITNLDETTKAIPLKKLQVAREIQERFDEGVFDDGTESQTEEDENNSGANQDSDDEDEIEHFDSTDYIVTNADSEQQKLSDGYVAATRNNENGRTNSNNTSMEAQTVNLDLYDEEIRDNPKSNSNGIHEVSEA